MMDFSYEAGRLIREGRIGLCGFPVDLLVTETGVFRFIWEAPSLQLSVVVPADREDDWPQGVADALAAIYQRIA